MSDIKIKEANLKFKALTMRPKNNYIVIHHVGTMPKAKVDAAWLHQCHLEKGWSGCGYHFVILPDGTIERGRPEWALGSHTKGHNNEAIGINVVGDFAKTEPTEAQIKSLVNLLKHLKAKYSKTQVVGHRDLMATDCPGNNLYKKIGQVKYYVNN